MQRKGRKEFGGDGGNHCFLLFIEPLKYSIIIDR
jgi:hypothetical protein